jgi:hypothetical protein
MFRDDDSTLRDSETASRSRKGRANPELNSDEPFFRAAQNPRALCGKEHQHAGTGPSFRRGTAAPTLVRASSQTGLVFEGWIEGTAIPELEAREIRIARKVWRDHIVTGVIVQKDAPDDLVTAVPVYARLRQHAWFF